MFAEGQSFHFAEQPERGVTGRRIAGLAVQLNHERASTSLPIQIAIALNP